MKRVRAYLDYACLGPPRQETLQALSALLAELAAPDRPGSPKTLQLFQRVEETRVRVAGFLHCHPSEIALVDSTTEGLGRLVSSLQLRAGDNVLVGESEFLSLSVIWREWRRRGVEVRWIGSSGGRLEVDDFRRAADRRTRVLAVSAVQEVSGYRADLEALLCLARELDALLVVDGIQEVGALPVDFSRLPVDAYAAGGHKWLCSPFGTGFLFVHRRLHGRLRPPQVGYLALATPPGGWESYLQSSKRSALDPLTWTDEARLLESGGTPNWTGAVALGSAIQQLDRVGMETVWERIRNLTEELREGLARAGLPVAAAPGNLREASGIVCFGLPAGKAAERRLWEFLAEEGVAVSLRRSCGVGGLRVAPHFDTGREEIDLLLELVLSFLKKV